MPGPGVYDLMYRTGLAGLLWSRVDRPEIRRLVEGGPCDPARLGTEPGATPRAIDLGCGEGAVSIYLAKQGFQTVGVDFSSAALRRARRTAARAGLDSSRMHVVQGDLTQASIPGVEGPFDLLVDNGTLDDLGTGDRRRAARLIDGLARPGSRLFLYVFQIRREELPLFSFRRPSRVAPEGLEPGEADALFGGSWDVERIPREGPPWISTFLLAKRAADRGAGPAACSSFSSRS